MQKITFTKFPCKIKTSIFLACFSTLLLSTAACATDPDVKPDAPIVGNQDLHSGFPLWQFCYDKNSIYSAPSLTSFIKKSDRIFIGKVIERKTTFKGMFDQSFNGCWAKFKIKEVLKGHLSKEIWVRHLYDERNSESIFGTYKNCYFKSGENYLVSGAYTPAIRDYGTGKFETKKGWVEFITSRKDVNETPKYICSPVEELPEGNAVVSEIRKILEN